MLFLAAWIAIWEILRIAIFHVPHAILLMAQFFAESGFLITFWFKSFLAVIKEGFDFDGIFLIVKSVSEVEHFIRVNEALGEVGRISVELDAVRGAIAIDKSRIHLVESKVNRSGEGAA